MNDYIVSDDEAGLPKSTQTRGSIFAGLTGRRGGDVSGGGEGSVRDQLLAAYGPGRRAGTVNTAAAAKDLGVTQRTVQRWITGAGERIRAPRAGTAKKLQTRSRQAATTKRGRAKAIAGRRGDKYSRYGGLLKVRGDQGTRGNTGYYFRFRTTAVELSPEEVEELRTAWVDGGDQGAAGWLQAAWGDKYVDDWNFGSIETLGFADEVEL